MKSSMLAGTQNHLKTKRLMRVAKIPLYRAVGILETLWLLCQDCCDEGNIGKYTDDEIADYLGWDGESSDLVRHLTDSGWVDQDPVHRLVIHDWLENCPEFIKDRVRKRRARAAEARNHTTYDGTKPDKVGHRRTTTGQPPDAPGLVPPITTLPITSNNHQPPPGEAGGGGQVDMEVWGLDSEARVRLALTFVQFHSRESLIIYCQQNNISPAAVVEVVDEYTINSSKFNGPGAIAERLKKGSWPADGIMTKAAASKKQTAKEKKASDSLAYSIIRTGRSSKKADDVIRRELEAAGLSWPNT